MNWGVKRSEREIATELEAHIEMAVERHRRNGMSEAEARRAARLDLGGVEQATEKVRDQGRLPVIETTWEDIRFGFRMLRRSPGVSLLAILCLTLGIGANAAVFSWIEGNLLRPYSGVEHQETLYMLAVKNRGAAGYEPLSWLDFQDYRRDCANVGDFIAEKISGSTLSIGDRAERVPGSVVSSNYFDSMGVHPVLGRVFEPAEETGRNGHPVAIISYDTWKIRFHGDPAIVGKTQMLNGVQHTIIGVTPEDFYGTFVGYAFKFWVPVSMQERFEQGGYKLEDRSAHWIEGFFRLKPGVTLEQAQTAVSAEAARLEHDFPDSNRGRELRILPLWQAPFNNASSLLPTLRISMGVALVLLLIACANVGNLVLVKCLSRRHEMTVRLAIGAGRARLIRQLVTESLMLSGIAALGGLAVAYLSRDLLLAFIPFRGVPLRISGEIDWRVLAMSAGVCVISTLIFGLFPAFEASRVDLAGALKSESGGVVGAGGRSWVRSTLVVVQVSLSFMLLVGAALLMESVMEIRGTDPGFSTSVLSTGMALPPTTYDTARARAFQDNLLERLAALPGVESAAFSRTRPFAYSSFSQARLAMDTYQPPPGVQISESYSEIGEGYFKTLHIPIVSGREFLRTDDEKSPRVAIIDETMADTYWHGRDPVGQRLQVKDQWMQIVGVAKAVHYNSILETRKPFFYVPLRQNFSSTFAVYLDTRQSVESLGPMLAREIHALDVDLAAYEVIPMSEQVHRKASSQQVALWLIMIFGAIALVLAGIGLYGVMSYSVSQSTRELGLRMALGADARTLIRLVMSKGAVLTGVGITVGAGVAIATTRLLGYLLYRVSPRDPLAFTAAFVVMAVTALVACFLPALRASRVDPLRALRM